MGSKTIVKTMMISTWFTKKVFCLRVQKMSESDYKRKRKSLNRIMCSWNSWLSTCMRRMKNSSETKWRFPIIIRWFWISMKSKSWSFSRKMRIILRITVNSWILWIQGADNSWHSSPYFLRCSPRQRDLTKITMQEGNMDDHIRNIVSNRERKRSDVRF